MNFLVKNAILTIKASVERGLLSKIFSLVFPASLIMVSNVYSDCLVDNDCCESHGKVTIGAECLIWRAYERGVEPCAFNKDVNVIEQDGRIVTHIKKTNHFNTTWNPGFRIGAGYQMNQGWWQSGLVWTHYDSQNKRSNNCHSITWNLHFDTIDAFIGYECESSSCFMLTPMAGLRLAQINQGIHACNRSYFSKRRENFCGIGPLIGFEAKWVMGGCLNLYANAYLSWLYGNYRIRFNGSNQFDDEKIFLAEKNHFNANQYVTDVAIGMQWDIHVCKHKIALRLGLEHHHYFDYNYLADGDLSLDGGIVSASFEF